ncbi:hypothetical protein AMS68_002295 [Peltaster fructicola]|uniref:Uncharacterized protein n=1 Tax=Peltaster fructicola TaxID=286661 RepID=A0A6H0XQ63_9PEZI|nr:hypothetical protein AMS68_002295 [Peltaster fructicola]
MVDQAQGSKHTDTSQLSLRASTDQHAVQLIQRLRCFESAEVEDRNSLWDRLKSLFVHFFHINLSFGRQRTLFQSD